MQPWLICLVGLAGAASAAPRPVAAIGSDLQLFVDRELVDQLSGGAELRLHQPVAREIALETGEPWEGNGTNYVTVFRDGPLYRMYYRGSQYSYEGGKDRPSHRDLYCYAESSDGVHWRKPKLGLFTWQGNQDNNIVRDGVGTHAFAPFRDENPACAPDARYKALGFGGPHPGLYAFKSADGLHWSLIAPEPVITRGTFDSLNLGFWDAKRGEYREYHRDFRGVKVIDAIGYSPDRGRDIRTSASHDFVHWGRPEFLTYTDPPGRVAELYTNQVAPYYRAPGLLLGFPTRYTDRGWTEAARALPRYDYRLVRAKDGSGRREGTVVTDGLLMSSRDGSTFSVWPQAFIRPGLHTRDSWFYGDTYQNWGLVETASPFEDGPAELSLYVTERTLQDRPALIRRYTLRVDGFVSLTAPLSGGELLSRSLRFTGSRLILNASTSGAGSIRVELDDAQGRAVPGYALADCDQYYGDALAATVTWRGRPDVGPLAGRPIRLRIEVKDADLYSFRFGSP